MRVGRVIFLAAAALLVGAATDPPRVAFQRTVHFTYTATLPEDLDGAVEAELWLPLPLESADQKVDGLSVSTALAHEIVTENRFGNRMLRVRGPALALAGAQVSFSFDVTRRAILGKYKSATPEELDLYRAASSRVPIDGMIAERAAKSAERAREPIETARALYDDVVANLDYDKTGDGWGRGDALYACTVEKGNCTDFHSLFIGMCRSLSIPARFTMGVPLPPDEPKGTVPGYHCWAEFYIEGQGWIPVDASEASKHPEREEFFFGSLDPDRIEFCRGRDITFAGLDAEPLNYFIYPYLLADGKPVDGTEHRFEYRDLRTPTPEERVNP